MIFIFLTKNKSKEYFSEELNTKTFQVPVLEQVQVYPFWLQRNNETRFVKLSLLSSITISIYEFSSRLHSFIVCLNIRSECEWLISWKKAPHWSNTWSKVTKALKTRWRQQFLIFPIFGKFTCFPFPMPTIGACVDRMDYGAYVWTHGEYVWKYRVCSNVMLFSKSFSRWKLAVTISLHDCV